MAAANPPPTTYAQLYQHGVDALAGQYANYLTPFGPDSGATPATLRDEVIHGEHAVPKIYLLLVEEMPLSPMVRVISRVTRVSASVGLPPRSIDNQTFAFASDIGPGNQVAIVHFPTGLGTPTTDAPFTAGPLTTVPVLANMDIEFQAAAAAASCVGPFNVGDANTEEIRSRRMVPVPQRYAHLVLGHSFSPRDLWTTLSVPIIADNNQASCAVLLDWIRVASTFRLPTAVVAPAIAGGPQAPGICMRALVAPILDRPLQEKVWSWVSGDLPALVTNTASLGQHLVNLTTEVAQTRVEQAAARAEAVQVAAAGTTFSSKYPNVAPVMRTLTLATRDAELSEFLQRMPTTSKSDLTSLLQAACNERASHHPNGFSAPTVTPELVNVIKNFKFGSNDPDDMMDSFSPCLLASSSIPSTERARERINIYNMVLDQQANVPMEALRALLASAPDFPITPWELVTTNQHFSIVVDVVFKPEHPSSVQYREFCINLAHLAGQIEANFSRTGQLPGYLPRFTRMIQIAWYRNLNDLKRNGTTAAPARFPEIINLIESCQWILLPNVPERYLEAPPIPPAAAGGQQRPLGIPILPAASAPPRQSPGAPAAGAPPAPGGRPAAAQVQVQNASPNDTLVQRYTASGTTIRAIATDRVCPRTDNGRAELCLSFHLRCSCYNACRRSATHRTLSVIEAGRIGDLLTAAGVP